MTLQSSGAISLGNLKNEFGGNVSPKLSDYYRNGTLNYNPDAVVPTNGTISFSKFYGLSKRVHTVFKTTTEEVVFEGIGGEIIQYSDGTTYTVPVSGSRYPAIMLKPLNGVQTIIHTEQSLSYTCALAGPGLTEIYSISNNPSLYRLMGLVAYNRSGDLNDTELFDRINLVVAPKYLPRNISDLTYFFYGAKNFNGDISNWEVSNVAIMNGLFDKASIFNRDISKWDVSNVTVMSAMFSNASQFNQNIGMWNVSRVRNMDSMFLGAAAFNQNISQWKVGNVINMSNMFAYSGYKNDLSSWCVGKITTPPTDFAIFCPDFTPALQPRWGTCPRGW